MLRIGYFSVNSRSSVTTGPIRPRKLALALSCVLVFVLLASTRLPAANRESMAALFEEANKSYQSGDFAAAERQYQQLLAKGVESGALYYNLGNACFKQKHLGEAIYFWEKAKAKLPRDPDVSENLALANLMVVDRIDVPPDPFPVRWADGAVHSLTTTQDSWILLLLFVVANLLFALSLLAKSPRVARNALMSALAIGFFALLLGCSLAWKIYERNYRQAGVVIEEKSEVRSGPGTENVVVFTVHEGILLRIRGESSGWYQISLPNGWSGWLQKSSVRIL